MQSVAEKQQRTPANLIDAEIVELRCVLPDLLQSHDVKRVYRLHEHRRVIGQALLHSGVGQPLRGRAQMAFLQVRQ